MIKNAAWKPYIQFIVVWKADGKTINKCFTNEADSLAHFESILRSFGSCVCNYMVYPDGQLITALPVPKSEPITVLRCSYCNESEGHLDTCPFSSFYAKYCARCGKTDFDDSTGCLAPSVLSPAAGDWVCTDANYSGPFVAGDDGDNPVCQYCGESYSHTEDCLYAYARSRKGSSK